MPDTAYYKDYCEKVLQSCWGFFNPPQKNPVVALETLNQVRTVKKLLEISRKDFPDSISNWESGAIENLNQYLIKLFPIAYKHETTKGDPGYLAAVIFD